MPKLTIKVHENNAELEALCAEAAKKHLIPRLLKLLPEAVAGTDIDSQVGGSANRTAIRLLQKVQRNPEFADSLMWWMLDCLDVYRKNAPAQMGEAKTKRAVREKSGMKATVCGGELAGVYDVEDLWKYANGKTADYSKYPRSAFAHRAELDNQPILPGYLGPMWDGDGLRYETAEIYRQMST